MRRWQRRGGVWVRESDSPALLVRQKSTSFLADFDYSLNPLAGCPFSCDDCYVPALPHVQFRSDFLPNGRALRSPATWGSWVEVRVRAVETLERALARGALNGARLFLSPLADVYWPGERRYRLTRALLERLAAAPVFDWLCISTRSDLVCRDIDLLQRLGDKVEVGISIPTDRVDVAAAFGRQNPSVERRFAALARLRAAGVPTRIQVAPLQPHTSQFAHRLAAAADWVWLDWHTHFAAGFLPLYKARGWPVSTPATVEAFAARLRALLGPARVRTGQAHFADRWPAIRRGIA